MNFLKHATLTLVTCALLTTPAAAQDRRTNVGAAIATIAGVAILAKVLKKRIDAGRAAPETVVIPRTETNAVRPKRHRARMKARAGQRRTFRNSGHDNLARSGQGPYRTCLRQRWTADGWVSYLQPACVAQINEARVRR